MKQSAAGWKTPAAFLAAGLAAWGLSTFAALTGLTGSACAAAAAAWLAYAAYSLTGARRNDGSARRVLLAAAYAVGLIFILKLPYDFSWHDLAAYSADFSGETKPDGHLGYIAWIVENNRLPLEYDPRIDGYSVFYNPPLYHMVQSAFMEINLLLLPESAALENLQVVTLMCAFGTIHAGMQLLQALGLSRRGVRTGLWVLCFQPMIHILGATLNNDILMILCAVRCCLYTVRWYHSRRMRDILGIALWLGCGMAVKLNCALLIPCIAGVFIYAFAKDEPSRRIGYVKPFAAFLGVSVPVAVAWPLYHMIAFQMPLTYVRLPAETINVSSYSLWARFGFPDWYAIRGLFYSPTRKINHNVWMQTLKTGLFDEMTLFAEGTVTWYVAYLLLVAFAGLLLLSLIFFVHMQCSRKTAVCRVSRLFLLGYGALLVGSYLKFCIDYPYICTFNFRYIVPVLALCAAAFAHFRDAFRFGWLAELYAAGFSLLGLSVYGIYFFG